MEPVDGDRSQTVFEQHYKLLDATIKVIRQRSKLLQKGSFLDVFSNTSSDNLNESAQASQDCYVTNEIKRRGCVIDLERTPQLEMRPGDELVAYIKVSG